MNSACVQIKAQSARESRITRSRPAFYNPKDLLNWILKTNSLNSFCFKLIAHSNELLS